jgi:hypothetical protein
LQETLVHIFVALFLTAQPLINFFYFDWRKPQSTACFINWFHLHMAWFIWVVNFSMRILIVLSTKFRFWLFKFLLLHFPQGLLFRNFFLWHVVHRDFPVISWTPTVECFLYLVHLQTNSWHIYACSCHTYVMDW